MYDQIAAVDEGFLFPPEVLDALTAYFDLDGISDRLSILEQPGLMYLNPSDSVPDGYLTCDGTAVSRETYAALFAHIGVVHGSGDGSTTFNLPNMKGRVPVGKDPSQTEFDTLAEAVGEKTHVLSVAEMPSHDHGGTTTLESADHAHVGTTTLDGNHQHSYTEPNVEGTATGGGGMAVSDDTFHGNSTGVAGAHQHTFVTAGVTANHSHGINAQGSGDAHNNIQPSRVVNYIIKY